MIENAFQEAWSLENRKTEDNTDLEQIGCVDRGNRRYILFQDTSGSYWYKTMIKKNNTYLPEEEAIFGQKKKPGKRPRQVHR